MNPDWKVGVLPAGETVKVGGGTSPLLEASVYTDVRRVNITNVIGTIVGQEEPDRWVILGECQTQYETLTILGILDTSQNF